MTLRRANQLHPDHAALLVIDIQEKLLPFIRDRESVLQSAAKLLSGCRCLSVPVLATEQYPKGIGCTVPAIKDQLNLASATTHEKLTFSAWACDSVREALRSLDRRQIILVGIETHVCVQQTALDLISRDFDVYVCADAIGSRGRMDYEIALERMRQEGAFVTTVESVLFELCNESGTPRFKEMIEVIKSNPPADV